MNTRSLLWIVALSGVLFATGCGPATWDRSHYGYPASSYYGGDPSYYGGYTPYYGDSYYYNPFYSAPSRSRSHGEEHAHLEHKYDKAMNRLARQEREAEAKLYRKYDGDTADRRFQEQASRIDRKYDYKRGKVERNVAKEHRKYHSGW
ncbi:MAG TPA: hypothetical protein VGX03_17395 [Candidatus Binatia bacterium]|jgi:hypothetical protein|nr:hypothetical protein [Candidatus Binatia bacterium]